MTDYIAFGAIEHLKKGWAIIPFMEKPHWWVERHADQPYVDGGGRVRFYKSLCGLEAQTDTPRPAIVPGNFPKCKRCQMLHGKGWRS